ncbi:hypothetical protein KSS87_001464, partial [Heliosperma pusillum]
MKEDSFFTQRITMQTVGNDDRLIVIKRNYNANIGYLRKTHRSHKKSQCKQLQTMGNEGRKTHCSHKELHCKQWV